MSNTNSSLLSPQKRKHNEFKDPDYPITLNDNIIFTNNKKPKDEVTAEDLILRKQIADTYHNRYERVREIVVREFDNEIKLKQEQIEEIEKRITKGRELLDRVRYSIIAEYYKNQEMKLSDQEANAIRVNQTLFVDEGLGPQMPIHPSLKKIIGKKPCNIKDILKPCPIRAAAKMAKDTIRMKAVAQKKKQRHIDQIIRQQGIVIDHSKINADRIEDIIDDQLKREHHITQPPSINTEFPFKEEVGVLNASRLNNKDKYLLIVGNTSKYIGGEGGSGNEFKNRGQFLSHKWLVYVRSKENAVAVENFVKKVRFFLHSSYRPNNIVDVSSPPFQLVRRGWGEFSMRIQLFFHDYVQQKPVQLVHNIVLDKTLSGLHTMGAETVMEIWLRSTLFNNKKILKSTINKSENNKVILPSKTLIERRNSFPNKKEDDNLFNFLNSIGEIPADVAKLQPTDQMRAFPSISTDEVRPINGSICCKGSISTTTPILTEKPLKKSNAKLKSAINEQLKLPDDDEKSTQNVGKTTIGENIKKEVGNSNSKISSHSGFSTKPSIIHTQEKTEYTSIPNLTKSPQASMNNIVTISTNSKNIESNIPKKIVQKQIIQLANSEGKVKNVPMLITKPNPSYSIQKGVSSAMNSKLNQIMINKLSLPLRSSISSTNSTSKNFIFQREGKLFIIDPLQMKLKQQQKKQVSLLKPQISLLRQKQHQQQLNISTNVIQSIACDHNYAPAPIVQRTIIPSNFLKPEHSVVLPPLRFGLKDIREEATNLLQLKQRLRDQMKMQFSQKRFPTIRSAVEYLLRRIPLIASESSTSVGYHFVKYSINDFNSLPPLKQRSNEWLRAKTISCYLRNHKYLQELCFNNANETFWSTREIIMFARFYAYTPVLKSFCSNTMSAIANADNIIETTRIRSLVKSEIMEEQNWEYESISRHTHIEKWVNINLEKLQEYEDTLNDNIVICVESSGDEVEMIGKEEEKVKKRKRRTQIDVTANKNDINLGNCLYLSPPEYLENELALLNTITKDLEICLVPEEIFPSIMHPMAQTIIAHVLRIFIEKLIRRTVSNKYLQQQQQQQKEVYNKRQNYKQASNNICGPIELKPNDIAKVITENSQEFDFLSNRNFGVPFISKTDIGDNITTTDKPITPKIEKL